ncbi:hypothetical protein [Streptomyces sp. DfronAA-171]|uniref:hypothetical protein n=1 Tax=Streptomyces sp. DfronAA-171 TaxID=1839777 RepID=UPI00081E6304|nr:hypothetical protein [Streptomyces sp. DfronAA-171]SCE24183.1 hypothetical protein GA0115252_13719 [Streptomyces sp. DfronAA-171]
MHQPEPPPPDGLLPLAATALDLHRVTCTGPLLAGPEDLDALHDLGCALLRLLDVHAERAPRSGKSPHHCVKHGSGPGS